MIVQLRMPRSYSNQKWRPFFHNEGLKIIKLIWKIVLPCVFLLSICDLYEVPNVSSVTQVSPLLQINVLKTSKVVTCLLFLSICCVFYLICFIRLSEKPFITSYFFGWLYLKSWKLEKKLFVVPLWACWSTFFLLSLRYVTAIPSELNCFINHSGRVFYDYRMLGVSTG